MQVSILKGIYADSQANFRASYPINREPVIGENGISQGYLRPSPGLTVLYTGAGLDRGAILWNGYCHRVMGPSLVRIDGGIVNLGTVGFDGGAPVSMDYSFDRLAVSSAGNLFYWDGATLTQVTDPDLGTVIAVIWIAGYFMFTDGATIGVTDLADPLSVNPLKYGSSEVDPDLILGLKKIRGEAYVLNRYTIQNLQNVGGSGFPFTDNAGGFIPKGCVSTHGACDFLETFAFVGGGRNEAVSVYLAGPAQALPISTPQIDAELAALTVEQQAAIEVEARVADDEQRLLIHLPNKTLVYYQRASMAAKTPVWGILASGEDADEAYLGRHFVYAQNRWLCGGPAVVGYLDETTTKQFDQAAAWRIDTQLLYNGGKGGIVRSVELVGLPGRGSAANPVAYFSMTRDGQTWTDEKAVSLGSPVIGRQTRMQWRPKTRFANYAGFRFRGIDDSLASFAYLEADIEPLNA